MPTIAIIGASTDRSKFGNKAVRAFVDAGFEVYPVHPSEKVIEGLIAYPSILSVPVEKLDWISFYLPPPVGLRVLDDVAKRPPKELWLNPGAESPELVSKAKSFGIKVVEACSIVAIGKSPSAYR